jgi:hypothetical protein
MEAPQGIWTVFTVPDSGASVKAWPILLATAKKHALGDEQPMTCRFDEGNTVGFLFGRRFADVRFDIRVHVRMKAVIQHGSRSRAEGDSRTGTHRMTGGSCGAIVAAANISAKTTLASMPTTST